MKLNDVSLKRLTQAHPDLARVIVRASDMHPLAFVITESARTMSRQKELFDSGASSTMNSRHIPKMVPALGAAFAHAVDLAVLVGKEVRWDGALYIDLAETVAAAAAAENVPVVWGGAWVTIKPTMDLGAEQAKYAARKKREGKRPLIDGPHFELNWKEYP